MKIIRPYCLINILNSLILLMSVSTSVENNIRHKPRTREKVAVHQSISLFSTQGMDQAERDGYFTQFLKDNAFLFLRYWTIIFGQKIIWVGGKIE